MNLAVSLRIVSQSAFLYEYIFLGGGGLKVGLISESITTMSWSLIPGITVVDLTSDGLVVR